MSALLLSDIHFDPFHDPAKAKQLSDAPVSQWAAILSARESAGQAQAFTALQKNCGARGFDTPYALMRSGLDAMRQQAPHARFITVSGDLVVHSLPCRYQALLPGRSEADYESFVEKTIQFVVEQLRATFPGVPVYVALGNNDTSCGDYHLDPNSAFLRMTAQIVAAGVPAAERRSVEEQFRTGGYYSVSLAPLRRTRLVVLNDVFLSPQYASCKGEANPGPAQTELDWLASQLDKAQEAGEQVWVMAHIPPGVNAFETVRKFRNVCAGEAPEMFLVPEDTARLDDILLQHEHVVRLGVFGHTHMDEMRMLSSVRCPGAKLGELCGMNAEPIFLKVVPSISPVGGNNPSFTIAEVDPLGTLRDYSVIVASNQTGIGTTWTQEYDYAETYREMDFSLISLFDLMANLDSDPKAQKPASQAYIQYYFKGRASAALAPFWPQYECSIDNLNPQDYTRCVCGRQK
jgi:sphingomyelin phosphodiesterase acid-like 3